MSALFVRLPVGLDDALDVLKTVSAEVGEDKRRHRALAAASFLRFLEPVPQDILAKGAGIMHYQPFFNLIVTNVPGPPVPLYALGARLVEVFPILPLVGNQSLAVAALSYEGQLNLGCSATRSRAPMPMSFVLGCRRVTNHWLSDPRVPQQSHSGFLDWGCSERFMVSVAALCA